MSRHLLVVDDSPQITDLLKQYLNGQGFLVATAQDGAEALGCVAQQLPGPHSAGCHDAWHGWIRIHAPPTPAA